MRFTLLNGHYNHLGSPVVLYLLTSHTSALSLHKLSKCTLYGLHILTPSPSNLDAHIQPEHVEACLKTHMSRVIGEGVSEKEDNFQNQKFPS